MPSKKRRSLVNLLRQSLLCRKRRERRRYYRNHYLLRPPSTRHLTVDQLLRVPNRVLRSKTPLISRPLTSNKNPLSEGLRFIVQAGLVYKTRTPRTKAFIEGLRLIVQAGFFWFSPGLAISGLICLKNVFFFGS